MGENPLRKFSPSAVLNYNLTIAYYRGIFVYNICLISISNSVSDGATNKQF